MADSSRPPSSAGSSRPMSGALSPTGETESSSLDASMRQQQSLGKQLLDLESMENSGRVPSATSVASRKRSSLLAESQEPSASHTSVASNSQNPERSTDPHSRTAKLILEQQDHEEQEGQIFFGALFNLEHSPAFKFLDQKRSRREMPEKRMDELKEYIRTLHSFLLKSNDFEKKLSRSVKSLAQEVTNQDMEMDHSATRQFSNNSTIGELKRSLLKIENEAQLAAEREKKLTRDLEESQHQKDELINEIEEIRKHKADLLEPQLIASTKELKLDVIQRRNQVDNLQKDLEEKHSTLDMCMREKERLENEKDRLFLNISRAAEMPVKIAKQGEVLRSAISSLQAEYTKQQTLSVQLDKEIDRLQRKRAELEDRKLDQAADFEQRRAEIMELEEKSDDVFKKHELAKEQLTGLKADRVKFELHIKHLSNQIKRDHEQLLKSLRERDQQLKHCRRLEMTVNNIHVNSSASDGQEEETKQQTLAVKREEKHLRKQIAIARKEIDMALYEYLQQNHVEKIELERSHAMYQHNQKLEKELDEVIHEHEKLEKAIKQAAAERELKCRNVIRISQRAAALKNESSVNQIAIVDNSKRCTEAVQRLKDFATMYDVVKNERNKYMNQIQTSMQRASEMKEKIRILSNEIEILRHEISIRERELQKRKQENDAAYSQRDAAKNDVNKLLSQYREKRDMIAQHLSRIDTLNQVINATEEDMLVLKTRFEQAAKDRNAVGMQVLDRNDELCILYEKLNIQVDTLDKGQEELSGREDEIRKLGIVKSSTKREVELLKTLRPKVAQVQENLEKVHNELDATRYRVLELSSKMESPEDPERSRYLKGKDPERNVLVDKIRKLEERLADKEEKILEKDLILTETKVMTERVKKQALEGRDDSNKVAMKLNDLAKRIRTTTRKMMAKVSELSMNQATALSLHQEKTEKEALIQDVTERMKAAGSSIIPWEDVEIELKRAEKVSARKELDKKRRQEAMSREMAKTTGQFVDLDDDGFYIVDKYRTAAEPRPNAYLPSDNSLPIPKPYGGQAPFKPTEQGAQMRHYRKPANSAIEI